MTSYLVMSKQIHVICYQCSHASDSFGFSVYSWNHKKDPKWSLFCHMVMKAHNLVQYSDPVQHPHKKAIQSPVATRPLWSQQWLGTVNKDNHSPFCRWCTYLVSLYKTCGYVPGVLRPQQFPKDVSETVNSQHLYNHTIGFDTSFHSMIYPKKSNTGYLQL